MGLFSGSTLLWLAAAALAGLAGMLMMRFAAGAARSAAAGEADPGREVYARQLAELDAMVDRGVLAPSERPAARAEAARRLLNAPRCAPEMAGSRRLALAAAALTGVAAVALYAMVGSPGTPDQPFKARIAAWSRTPPSQLRPDQIAAVLREVAKTRPNDPRLLTFLAQAERGADDAPAAVADLRKAIALDPRNADLQAMLGEALAAEAGGKPTPEAVAALKAALQIEPNNQQALFYLGGAEAALGQRADAGATWRRLAGRLDAKDPRREKLLALARQIETAPAAPADATAPPSPSVGAAQMGFIRGMVASLQARLDAQPDNAAGWAQLVRSYRVLGDTAAEAQALARARSQFAGRPDQLRPIEAEADPAVAAGPAK